MWGVFRLTPYKSRAGDITALQMSCRHPNHVDEGSICTKQRSVKFGGLDFVRRQLKFWALQGLELSSKSAHSELWQSDIVRISEEQLPSEEELDSLCPEEWPTV